MEEHRRLDPLAQATPARIGPHPRELLVDELRPVRRPQHVGYAGDDSIGFAREDRVRHLAGQGLPFAPLPNSLGRDHDVAVVERLERDRIEHRRNLRRKIGQHRVRQRSVVDLEPGLRRSLSAFRNPALEHRPVDLRQLQAALDLGQAGFRAQPFHEPMVRVVLDPETDRRAAVLAHSVEQVGQPRPSYPPPARVGADVDIGPIQVLVGLVLRRTRRHQLAVEPAQHLSVARDLGALVTLERVHALQESLLVGVGPKRIVRAQLVLLHPAQLVISLPEVSVRCGRIDRRRDELPNHEASIIAQRCRLAVRSRLA